MDTYVFGAAFFYVMMILFTVYMFLFAAPSSYKLCSYNILSYLLMIVDVILMVQFYKLSINGKRRKNMRSLLSLLLQLTDSFSLVILLVLMIREKMILPLCYKNPHLIEVQAIFGFHFLAKFLAGVSLLLFANHLDQQFRMFCLSKVVISGYPLYVGC